MPVILLTPQSHTKALAGLCIVVTLTVLIRFAPAGGERVRGKAEIWKVESGNNASRFAPLIISAFSFFNFCFFSRVDIASGHMSSLVSSTQYGAVYDFGFRAADAPVIPGFTAVETMPAALGGKGVVCAQKGDKAQCFHNQFDRR